jgi:hypothetical protein
MLRIGLFDCLKNSLIIYDFSVEVFLFDASAKKQLMVNGQKQKKATPFDVAFIYQSEQLFNSSRP